MVVAVVILKALLYSMPCPRRCPVCNDILSEGNLVSTLVTGTSTQQAVCKMALQANIQPRVPSACNICAECLHDAIILPEQKRRCDAPRRFAAIIFSCCAMSETCCGMPAQPTMMKSASSPPGSACKISNCSGRSCDKQAVQSLTRYRNDKHLGVASV